MSRDLRQEMVTAVAKFVAQQNLANFKDNNDPDDGPFKHFGVGEETILAYINDNIDNIKDEMRLLQSNLAQVLELDKPAS